ncbi:MAG: hypothetical protein HYZ75_09470 [Elusimicrobia bacterium]|nr:hypothetical protein [Elusimicrobiota bacterium]
MRLVPFAAVLVLSCPLSASAQFSVEPTNVEIVQLMPAVDAAEPAFTPPLGGEIGIYPIVTRDRIVNTASRGFDVISENRPSVTIDSSFANAFPHGITHVNQLEGWSRPVSVNYGLYARNRAGEQVVAATYRVIRRHSGKYLGRGSYLDRVTVEPLTVTAAPGWRFTMRMVPTDVRRVGTSQDPIASMRMSIEWTIVSPQGTQRGTSLYLLDGAGAFHQLSGPFRSEARSAARATLERAETVLGAASRAW